MQRLASVLAAILLGSAIGAAPVALARFQASADTTGTFSTATIAPPTGLAAAATGTTVTLTWTPSVTSAADGYTVHRGTAAGGPYTRIGPVTPVGATTTTDTPGTGTWYYVLRTFLGSWTSALSNEAMISIGMPVSTGLKDCSSQAADTGGDNNGYETNPARGCATPGQVAVDANSGTNATLSCTDAGKDRHRFWGYDFGVPPGAAAINGMTVQLVAGMNNNGGTTRICAQLSWDGGTTWTSAKQVTLAGTALSTYTLGGSADDWGHGWSPAQLSATSFQLRLIDVTSQPNKDFRLDSATIGVTYTP
jgi:hypothetical protein